MLLGAVFFLVGLFEEFLLRGYSLFTLARGIGFWPAALVLSGAFGLIHLETEESSGRDYSRQLSSDSSFV